MNEITRLPTGLTLAEYDSLRRRLGNALSDNTIRAYTLGWETWRAWASRRGLAVCPAQPGNVAAFLDQLAKERSLNTVSLAKTSIGKMHFLAGYPNPCQAPVVSEAHRAISRMAQRPRQAKPLTAEALKRMAGVMTERDFALLCVMRDGLLRVSEVAALTWKDIIERDDATGRLFLERSKTDQEGRGFYAFLSPATLQALAVIPCGEPDDAVFGLTADHISRRIKTLAIRAGLGAGYSGHSPRIGMAVDLAEAGAGLAQLMKAGRWRSDTMVARYTEQITAGRNAVAQFYASQEAT